MRRAESRDHPFADWLKPFSDPIAWLVPDRFAGIADHQNPERDEAGELRVVTMLVSRKSCHGAAHLIEHHRKPGQQPQSEKEKPHQLQVLPRQAGLGEAANSQSPRGVR